MTAKNRYGYRVLGEGYKVSNNTRETYLNNNDLIVGSSGSSKTGSIVYAQLRSLHDSSLIVADTKGRLHDMFKKELTGKGYDVKVLDLVNPEKSCKYNPLSYIRKTENGYKEIDIAKLAASLVPLDKIDARDPFWGLSARCYLEYFIAYTLFTLPEEDHNMYTVARLFSAFKIQSGGGCFASVVRDYPHSLLAARYNQIKGTMQAEKTLSSIYAFVDNALAPFLYEEYKAIFDPEYGKNRGMIDIAALGRKKTVVFLNISDTDHSADSLVNIFYTQALQTLIYEADMNKDGQLKVPVRIIMDDFASSALINDFDRIISVVRSRDIWLTLCIQSLTQLESLYTHEQAMTVINNCDHIVFLGSNDLKSAEFIGTRARRTQDVILAMDRSKEYIIEGGKPAVLINKTPSYAYVDDAEPVSV